MLLLLLLLFFVCLPVCFSVVCFVLSTTVATDHTIMPGKVLTLTFRARFLSFSNCNFTQWEPTLPFFLPQTTSRSFFFRPHRPRAYHKTNKIKQGSLLPDIFLFKLRAGLPLYGIIVNDQMISQIISCLNITWLQ